MPLGEFGVGIDGLTISDFTAISKMLERYVTRRHTDDFGVSERVTTAELDVILKFQIKFYIMQHPLFPVQNDLNIKCLR